LAAITIWGDNLYTTKVVDGAYDGEILKAKLFNQKSGTLETLPLNQIREITKLGNLGSISYLSNGVYFANAAGFGSGISLSVNPNPVSGVSIIDFSTPESGNSSLELYDLQGNMIWNRNISDGVNSVEFDSKNIADGTYQLLLRNGSQLIRHVSLSEIIDMLNKNNP